MLPCLPLTPNKVSDLEMTPDAHMGPPSLRLLSKPTGDTLSNSLRRRAAVTRALAGSFLQSPRDAQMINVRDLGVHPCMPASSLCRPFSSFHPADTFQARTMLKSLVHVCQN